MERRSIWNLDREEKREHKKMTFIMRKKRDNIYDRYRGIMIEK